MGNFSVALFIVISGFLNAYNDNTDNLKFNSILKNTKKRVSKVFPLHVVTLLAVLFFKIITKSFESTDTVAFPLNLLMIQGFVPLRSIYYSYNKLSWYLSLYLLFSIIELPLVYFFRKLSKQKRLILGICVLIVEIIWLTIFQHSSNAHWFCYICPWFRCLDYILGLITGSFFREKMIKGESDITANKKKTSEIIKIILLLIFAFGCIACKKLIPMEYYKVFYSIACCILIYLFATVTISSPKVIKVINKLGALSFDWYLVHQIVIGVITIVIKNEFIAFGAVLICTAIGVLIWDKLFTTFKSRIAVKKAL